MLCRKECCHIATLRVQCSKHRLMGGDCCKLGRLSRVEQQGTVPRCRAVGLVFQA